MNKEQIFRLNELYKKSLQQGLTEREKDEQLALRTEYIQSIQEKLKQNEI